MYLLADLGMLREQVPGPAEGVRGGLLRGQDDGHDLVAEALAAHRLQGRVLTGGKEMRQEVLVLVRIAPALSDDVVHQVVQIGERALEGAVALGGQILGKRHQRPDAPFGFAQNIGKMIGDDRSFAPEGHVEQGPKDHVQGQRQHRLVDVDRFAGVDPRPPVGEQAVGGVDDALGDLRHGAAPKRGRERAPLFEPDLAFAQKDALAQDRPHLLVVAALAVVRLIVLQHALDVLGPVEHQDRRRADVVARDAAVVLRQSDEIGQPVGAHLQKIANDGKRLGPVGIGGCGAGIGVEVDGAHHSLPDIGGLPDDPR